MMTQIGNSNRDKLESAEESFTDKIKQLAGFSQDEEQVLSETDYTTGIALSTDEEIVDSAFERLIREKQLSEYKENPTEYPDPSHITVDINIEDKTVPPRRIEDELVEIRDNLVDELGRIRSLEENTVSGTDFNTLVYMISKNAGKNQNITIIGGGETIIRNLCNRLSLSEDAKQLVLFCHKEATSQSGLKRHLIHDVAVFIPHEKREWDDAV